MTPRGATDAGSLPETDECQRPDATALTRLCGKLTDALSDGARLVQRDPQGRHPAEELIDMVQESDAELVVIGVRNRSRMSKILLGSDAQSIILGSPVPVLTVKAASNER